MDEQQYDEGTETGSFVIDDDSKAAWAMRKLRELRRRQDEINKVVITEVEALNDWADKKRAGLDRDLTHFENLLIDYARNQRKQFDRKTIDLPTGRVTSRAVSESWEIESKEFISWAREFAPTLVRSKVTELPETVEVLEEHLKTAEGKVIVKQTGEIVEGIKVKDATINYKVEVDK